MPVYIGTRILTNTQAEADGEIEKGRQAPQAGVFPKGKFIPTSSVILHRIFTNCGYVIESYVENPSKFKG